MTQHHAAASPPPRPRSSASARLTAATSDAPKPLGWTERPALIAGAALGTQCVHAGVQPDPTYGAVMPPIYQTSTFAFKDIGVSGGFDYSRSGNPTRTALQDAINTLEGGSGASCTASGMAAIQVALNLFETCDHIIATVDCYGGTFRLLEHLARQYSLKVQYVDLTDLDAVAAAIQPATRAIWVETPSNPLLRVTDLAAITALARQHELLTIVDNTFLSPALQRPFEFGADLVVHSTTKYLNGHSDVVGGAIVAGPDRPDLAERTAWLTNALGVPQGPFECFLVLRGLKTLDLRVHRHEANAASLARWLQRQDAVAAVLYPGLPSHPQHALARRQQKGFGGMISVRLRGGRAAAEHVMRAVRWFTLAESLGGVESLICHPASMTHASMTPEARAAAGITDDIVRLSVGIESADDLIADLAAAFATLPATAVAPLAPVPASIGHDRAGASSSRISQRTARLGKRGLEAQSPAS